MAAPSSQSTMYHISAFPASPCSRRAVSSEGCTWMDRSFRASMSFTSSGKSFIPAQSVPQKASLSSAASSSGVFPASGPLSTAETPSARWASSQLSAVMSGASVL